MSFITTQLLLKLIASISFGAPEDLNRYLGCWSGQLQSVQPRGVICRNYEIEIIEYDEATVLVHEYCGQNPDGSRAEYDHSPSRYLILAQYLFFTRENSHLYIEPTTDFWGRERLDHIQYLVSEDSRRQKNQRARGLKPCED